MCLCIFNRKLDQHLLRSFVYRFARRSQEQSDSFQIGSISRPRPIAVPLWHSLGRSGRSTRCDVFALSLRASLSTRKLTYFHFRSARPGLRSHIKSIRIPPNKSITNSQSIDRERHRSETRQITTVTNRGIKRAKGKINARRSGEN